MIQKKVSTRVAILKTAFVRVGSSTIVIILPVFEMSFQTATENCLSGILLEFCMLDFSIISSCLKYTSYYLIVDDREKYGNEKVLI